MKVEVETTFGPKGGEYLSVALADGRRVSVSNKPNDTRVWLGNPSDTASYEGQKGGVGKLAALTAEARANVDSAIDMLAALTALQALKEHGS